MVRRCGVSVSAECPYLREAGLVCEQLPRKRLTVLPQHIEDHRVFFHQLLNPLPRSLLEATTLTFTNCLRYPAPLDVAAELDGGAPGAAARTAGGGPSEEEADALAAVAGCAKTPVEELFEAEEIPGEADFT